MNDDEDPTPEQIITPDRFKESANRVWAIFTKWVAAVLESVDQGPSTGHRKARAKAATVSGGFSDTVYNNALLVAGFFSPARRQYRATPDQVTKAVYQAVFRPYHKVYDETTGYEWSIPGAAEGYETFTQELPKLYDHIILMASVLSILPVMVREGLLQPP